MGEREGNYHISQYILYFWLTSNYEEGVDIKIVDDATSKALNLFVVSV